MSTSLQHNDSSWSDHLLSSLEENIWHVGGVNDSQRSREVPLNKHVSSTITKTKKLGRGGNTYPETHPEEERLWVGQGRDELVRGRDDRGSLG